jgi:coenzyme PQQ biosynthesis protein PqqD
MASSHKPIRIPEFRLEKMDNELLLFNSKSTNVLYLNESASVIWQLCDGQRSVDEIITLLASTYPEAADSIRSDVQETIEMFLSNQAVRMI